MTSAQFKPRSRFRRFISTCFYLSLATLGAFYAMPFKKSHAEQDRCEFGTGSTALYERMEREASSFLEKNGRARLWSYSLASAGKFSGRLRSQIEEFALSRNSVVERTAAMHALLRSYGMHLDVSSPLDERVRKSNRAVLSYRYIILLPKLNMICPTCYIFKTASFGLSIHNDKTGEYNRIHHGGLRITWFKWSPVYYKLFGEICPKLMGNV